MQEKLTLNYTNIIGKTKRSKMMNEQYTPKDWDEFWKWVDGDSGMMKKQYKTQTLEDAIDSKRNYDIQVNADMAEMSWEIDED